MDPMRNLEDECTHNCNTCSAGCKDGEPDKVTDIFESIGDFVENIDSKDLLAELEKIVNK